MMYEKISATLDTIVKSSFEHGSYKFFLLVNGDDGKKYQIKLNGHKQRNNINEFIAHFVGRCSDMPLLKGVFIELDEHEIQKLQSKLEQLPKGFLASVDIGAMKENLFFAIEWKQHITKVDTEFELLQRVSDTRNQNAFYSLYSFDQLLRNKDRHLDNHLIVQEGKAKTYYLIDFDRIFASTNWSKLSTEYDCFIPFSLDSDRMEYHSFLMSIVNDSTISFVHSYAGKLESIATESIRQMCDIILFVYDVSASEVESIFEWIETRKAKIVMKCFVGEKCFPNVINKGLFSVY